MGMSSKVLPEEDGQHPPLGDHPEDFPHARATVPPLLPSGFTLWSTIPSLTTLTNTLSDSPKIETSLPAGL